MALLWPWGAVTAAPTPVSAVVQGRVVAVAQSTGTLWLQTPPVRRYCPSSQSCPLYVTAPLRLEVRMSAAKCLTALGTALPCSAVGVGAWVAAAGRFAAAVGGTPRSRAFVASWVGVTESAASPTDATPAPIVETTRFVVISAVRSGNGVTVTGRARVFEATFAVELLDASGAVVLRASAHAAAGAPAWGAFHAKLTAPKGRPFSAIVLFEPSPKDGLPMGAVTIGV